MKLTRWAKIMTSCGKYHVFEILNKTFKKFNTLPNIWQ
jgi:hypothetical protein